MKNRGHSWRPHIFLILANLIYGANYTIAKTAMPDPIGPFAFILIRVSVALLLFTFFRMIFIREKVQRSDLVRLAICGLFGVAINQLMFFKGLAITSEIHASLIMITTPIFVLIVSRFILGERITVPKMTGMALGACGVAWLILQGGSHPGSGASVAGDVFILINATSYGLYLVLVKPLMSKYHPVTVINYVFFFGWFVVTPFGIGEFTAVNWAHLPVGVWWAVVYVVIGTTFLAYLFNTMALRDASPTIASAYIYTQPVIASAIALAIGNDTLNWMKLAASMLIITGVYLVSTYRPPAKS